MRMIITTSYTNPDLDGVACAVATAEFLRGQGRDARAAIFGQPSLEAKWFLETFAISTPPDGRPILTAGAEVVLLDASNPLDLAFPVDVVVEIVDHRQTHQADAFPNAKDVQIELVGSCATLVAERMRAAHVTLTRESARLLSGAIASNTVNFKAPVTTDRDRAAFAWLAPIAMLPETFIQDMFTAKSDLSGDRLREALLGDYTMKEFGGHRIIWFQLEASGIAELYRTRRAEIETIMREACTNERCEYAPCGGIDLVEEQTYMLVIDP
ncbi:MAG: hypothetical protein Q7R80_03615, partial [bacterium]|nr:hypothetical protein [bacterium]